jgi:hypothetical protein
VRRCELAVVCDGQRAVQRLDHEGLRGTTRHNVDERRVIDWKRGKRR